MTALNGTFKSVFVKHAAREFDNPLTSCTFRATKTKAIDNLSIPTESQSTASCETGTHASMSLILILMIGVFSFNNDRLLILQKPLEIYSIRDIDAERSAPAGVVSGQSA